MEERTKIGELTPVNIPIQMPGDYRQKRQGNSHLVSIRIDEAWAVFLLSKMAGDFSKPDKVHTLFPEEVERKIWPLPVSELFFVGRATTKKLFSLGIRTIGCSLYVKL